MITMRINASTTILKTASGLRMSFFMLSFKKVVDSLITSCCFFSSAVAGSNSAGSICMLKGAFFGVVSLILSVLLNQR